MHNNVVVLGGGTGSFTLLSSLKHVTPNLTAIVTMADDGGSTGVLRDELGVLPPGDIRQCLVALSDDDVAHHLRELFNFRFSEGSLAGHSFGNLFLSAMEKMTDDIDEGIRLAGEILKIHGRIVPITHDNVRLAIQWGDEVVHGEGAIDVMDFGARQAVRPHLFLEPRARINPKAAEAIAAPGDIYTSLGALLVVDGVGEALERSTARKLYVCNLSVNPRQTKGWTVTDYADELERLAGLPFIDDVLYNTVEPPHDDVFRRYEQQGEVPVRYVADPGKRPHYQLTGRNLIGSQIVQSVRGDKLAGHRSFIRHDADVVAEFIRGLLETAPKPPQRPAGRSKGRFHLGTAFHR